MDGFQFIDIILLAMVAGFIVLRLRNVLGRRTGHEPSRDARRNESLDAADNVVTIPSNAPRRAAPMSKLDIEPAYQGTPLEPGMVQLKMADPGFTAESFLQGAAKAFEIIIAAYAKADTDALRPLLSADVYSQFARAIQEREDRKETLTSELVVLKPPRIESVEVRDGEARIAVIFQSEQSNVIKNAQGEVIEGSPDHVESVTDVWTFARDTAAGDPNWTLVATRSVE